MAGVNKVILVGNLGKDPESRSLNNGGKVVTFSLATSESWKNKDGERQERTEWHNVVIFNEGLGGIAEQYLRKGSKCYVEGKMQTRKWTDKDGNDRYSTEVVLQQYRGEICLLDSRDSGGDNGRSSGGGGRSSGGRNEQEGMDYGDGRSDDRRAQPRPQPAAFDPDLDDDVPF